MTSESKTPEPPASPSKDLSEVVVVNKDYFTALEKSLKQKEQEDLYLRNKFCLENCDIGTPHKCGLYSKNGKGALLKRKRRKRIRQGLTRGWINLSVSDKHTPSQTKTSENPATTMST